jgi:hypothetical protein
MTGRANDAIALANCRDSGADLPADAMIAATPPVLRLAYVYATLSDCSVLLRLRRTKWLGIC